MTDVGELVRREIANHFEAERVLCPVYAVLCLKHLGLSNELAMRVLLCELPEELSVKLVDNVQSIVANRKRLELKVLRESLNTMLGLRAQLLPARAGAVRLTKPALVQEIVQGIWVGPETDADRQRELRRLRAIYHALQETLQTTPKRRKLLPPPPPRTPEGAPPAQDGAGEACPPPPAGEAPATAATPAFEALPTCIWCKRPHAKRAFLKCAQACNDRSAALAQAPGAPVSSRFELVTVLKGVNAA